MSNTLSADDWIISEAVRLHEEHHGRRRDDAAAVASACAVEAELANRLALRAQALPGAEFVRADIKRLRWLGRKLGLGLIALGAIGGALAARASIADREVDILLAATSLLLLPAVMLLLWLLLVIVAARRKTSASVAGLVVAAGLRWLGPRLLRSDHAAEVTIAGGSLLRSNFGRWLLSSVAHAFWIAYALAALVTLSLFFAIVQYDLSWGTTLLRDDTVVNLMTALAQVPSALGLIPPPQPEWILSGREGALATEGRALWAQFLLAMIVVYGLLPRVFFGVLSSLLALITARRLTLDTRLPGYLRLAAALQPLPATNYGQAPAAAANKPRRRPQNPQGEPLMIGLELEPQSWPLQIPGVQARVLGRADDRASRQQLLAALQALRDPPPAMLVACSMLRTPDTGSERFIDRAADAAATLPLLLLLESDLLIERGGQVTSRLADWQALAQRVGGEALLFDSSEPEAAAIARLLHCIRGGADE